MSLPHQTVPIQVWVDVDVDVADTVLYLNTIPGVRTLASCQGTIGEGGAEPYRAQVMASWAPEATERIHNEFDVDLTDSNGSWGYLRPKNGAATFDRTLEVIA